MAPMIKGFLKGIWQMSNKLAYKEHQMEIGYPTDVRHVAHIGWDGADSQSPSWMNEYKNARDFSQASLSIPQSRDQSWTSQDFEITGFQSPSQNVVDNLPSSDKPKIPKNKRVKNKASPKSSSSRSSARSSKSGTTFAVPLEGQEPIPNQIKVN